MIFTDGIERMRKVRLFTGPCGVDQIAAKAQEAGYTVLAGTEHIYVNLVDKGDGWGILESIDNFEAAIGIKLTDGVFKPTVFDIPL